MKKNQVSHWLPCPVVFVSTADGERRDIMTATAMFVSEEEDLLLISLAKGHLTDELIEKTGHFMIGLASAAQAELVWKLGSVRGDRTNKVEKFSVPTVQPKPGKPAIPQDSAAWMECRVERVFEAADTRLVMARVVDQGDMGKPAIVWQEDSLFGLSPI